MVYHTCELSCNVHIDFTYVIVYGFSQSAHNVSNISRMTRFGKNGQSNTESNGVSQKQKLIFRQYSKQVTAV